MNPAQCSDLDPLSNDPVYLRLKEFVIESTGMAYYADKDTDLLRRIRYRLAKHNLEDCACYFELLHDPVRGPAETEALINEITIGETYFFRHNEHFDALRAVVLPDLIRRNSGTRRLRIWCAGCADGAEPYSLSILLRRELPHLLIGWEISILATDINRRYLEIAREGRYEQWSLRSISEQLRRECFETQGKQWKILPQYKAGVSFRFHNLVEDVVPLQLGDLAGFDLIICRNVMIYFSPKLMRRVVRRFHECLPAGGWLLVGPSEPNMTHFTSFCVVNAPGVTLYQKPADGSRLFAEPEQFTESASFALSSSESALPPSVAITVAPEPPIHAGVDAAVPTLDDLRRRADQGDWDNAVRCGKELIESDNLNALVHFQYALVLEQIGDPAESERSLRRAIYLDRQAVLAHYHLALLLRSRGDLDQAERYLQNTLTLLGVMRGEEILADADGLTAGELRKLTETQIENLRLRA